MSTFPFSTFGTPYNYYINYIKRNKKSKGTERFLIVKVGYFELMFLVKNDNSKILLQTSFLKRNRNVVQFLVKPITNKAKRI